MKLRSDATSFPALENILKNLLIEKGELEQ
jgi:hypothetical protein